MEHFGAGLLLLFFSVSILIRFPLIGYLVLLAGLILPFPNILCAFLSTSQCGSAALKIDLEADIPIFWRVYMLVLFILIPLGMEQSKRRGELYDLKEGLAFYKAYHSNPINEAIHLVCIPGILWSTIGLFSYTSPMFGPGTSSALDWSALVAIIYAQVKSSESAFAAFILIAAAAVLPQTGWPAKHIYRLVLLHVGNARMDPSAFDISAHSRLISMDQWDLLASSILGTRGA